MNRSLTNRWLMAVAAALGLMSGMAQAPAHAGHVRVVPDPVLVDGIVVVDLFDTVTAASAGTVHFAFDGGVVQLLDAAPNPLLPGADDPLAHFLFDNGDGTWSLLFALLEDVSGADVHLASFHFRAVQTGVSPFLAAGFYEQRNGALVEIAAEGIISVADRMAELPAPAVLPLFLSGLGCLAMATRRRSREVAAA